MSAYQPLVDRWVEFLTTQDHDIGRSVVADDIAVFAYMEGAGGPETRFERLPAVLAWADRAPKNKYIWEVLSIEDVEADPRLPAADATLKVLYSIRVLDAEELTGWSNRGYWTMAFRGERLAGLVHEPNVLTDEQWTYVQRD